MRELIQAEQALGDYTRKHARHILAGVLGNNAGTVDHATRVNFVYVRLHGDANQVVEAEAIASFPHTAGIVVAVELIKRNAASRYQVLGIASNILYVGSPWAGTVGAHADQHQRRDLGQGGFDPLDIYNRALVNLRGRAQATPDLTLYVERGFYFIGGVLYEWTGGNSPAFTIPAGSFGITVRRCDLLYINAASALAIVQGATTSDGSVPPYPTTPYPCIPVAYVYLTSSSTSIGEDNIKDARVILTASDGTAVVHNMITSHTYTGGAALDVFGLSAPNTIAKLTPSSNPGAASAILKSDASGYLQLTGLGLGTAVGGVGLKIASAPYTANVVMGTDAAWANGIRMYDNGFADLRIWASNTYGRIILTTGYNGDGSIVLPTDGLSIQQNLVGIGILGATAKLHVVGTSDVVQFVVKANSTQTSDLAEWQNSGGGVLARVTGVGKVGIGTTPDTQYLIVAHTYTETSGTKQLGRHYAILSPTNNSTAEVTALRADIETDGAYTLSSISGLEGTALHFGTNTLDNAYGLNYLAGNYGTGTVTLATAVYTRVVNNNASGTIDTARYLWLASPNNSGTITNLYGLYISNMTAGGTLNYAIYTEEGANRLGDTLALVKSDAATSAITNIEDIQHISTGTPAAGFGAGLRFGLASSTTANQDAARVTTSWVSATHASRTARLALLASDSGGEREGLRIEGSGTAPMLSFYGGAAVARGAALTAQLTTLTHTAPGTPDYAIQDFAQNGGAGIWGFADHDEANSVLAVIANLQTRVAELEARLGSATGVNLFA